MSTTIQRFLLCIAFIWLLAALILGCSLTAWGVPTFNSLKHRLATPRCQPPEYTKHLSTNVQGICKVLNAHGVDYWLMDGTLFGAVYGGGDILPTDHDADIGYLWRDAERVQSALGGKFSAAEGTVDLKRYEERYASSNVGAPVVPLVGGGGGGGGDGSTVSHEQGIGGREGEGETANDATPIMPKVSLHRVLAPHEIHEPGAFLAAWYNSGFDRDDIFPVLPLGGTGPLRHCKVPARSRKLMLAMFGPYEPVDCAATAEAPDINRPAEN